jgi:1,4-dihydroxy-2-naphthoate octaprenyltransferase
MPPAEPTLASLPNPLLRYVAATRPPFLSVTLVGCLLGLAVAHAGGVAIDAAKAIVTVVFALLAHAGANVINDYYDALSGCDAANTDRLFPFTGGSRMIQNGVLTLQETARLGFGLFAVVIPAGLWLTATSAPGLILIGLAGLLLGWAYSAPPPKLVSRGLGELAITASWLVVVCGADFVQRGAFSWMPLLFGMPFALLVANILFINQFPDVAADRVAGKRTLVVRAGPLEARWFYLAIAALAYGWMIVLMDRLRLPGAFGVAVLPVLMSLRAGRTLLLHATEPSQLAPALKLTIGSALAHGLLLCGALVAAGHALQ